RRRGHPRGPMTGPKARAPQNKREQVSMTRRAANGQFVEGEPGNPGGRPKGFGELIRAMTADGADLVAFVHGVFANPANSIFVRMVAATWLADRGFGKPKITTEILQSAPPRPPLDLSKLTIEELRT